MARACMTGILDDGQESCQADNGRMSDVADDGTWPRPSPLSPPPPGPGFVRAAGSPRRLAVAVFAPPRAAYAGVAELSIYVAAWARAKGVGSALIQAAIKESEHFGIWTLQGSIMADNIASLKLVEAAGFRQVGVREKIGKQGGKWRDTILVERRSKTVGVD